MFVPHQAAHPGVEVRLRFAGSAQLIGQLAAGRLDVALVAWAGPPPPGVRLVPLASEPLVVLCHPGHELAGVGAVSLAGLAGMTFVGFQPDWGARVLADRVFAAAGLGHRVELEVNDVHTLLDLVGHNLGVAIVPRPIAARKGGRLHVTALAGDLPSWQVAVAVSDNPSPAARALLAQFGERQAALSRAQPAASLAAIPEDAAAPV